MKILRRVAAGVLAILVVMWCGAASAQSADARPWGTTALRVDGFDVEQVAQLSPGTQLLFTLFGTSGAQASLRIDGAARRLDLVEGQSGVYEGTYTLGAADRIAPDSRVVANLHSRNEAVTSVLEEPLVLGATALALPSPSEVQAARVLADATPVPPPPPPIPSIAPVPLPRVEAVEVEPACTGCGIVEAINESRPPPPMGWLGAIAGGLLGAILGDQVGRGEGRNGARILGAVGGAYAGRQIERSVGSRTRYEVVVRLASGERRTVSFSSAPPLRVGDRVTFADGNVRRRP